MDLTSLIFIAVILTYVGFTVYVANLASVTGDTPNTLLAHPLLLRGLLLGFVVMMFVLGMSVIQLAIISESPVASQTIEMPAISFGSGLIAFAAAAVAAAGSYLLITNEAIRTQLESLLARAGGNYRANAPVHTTAAVLMLGLIVYVVADFILRGGVGGLAQDIQTNGIEPGDVVFQAALQIVITFLGVGFAIRRDTPHTLARLGLRWPQRDDLVWGAGAGILFLILMIVFNQIWAAFTSPELLAEQTSAAFELNRAFATLPLAFILSVSAAFGEEIWLRGGLQPIFGIGVTSVFFTLLHTQVIFTPAMVIPFAVSLGFGWLRARQSTVAAIIAHFVFNFVQLALLALVIEAI